MMEIDTSTEFGRRVEHRLRNEEVIWLTTVRRDGGPVSMPVWFCWEGKTVLIYSQPNKPKLRNIASNPKVSLNFNTDEQGDNVVQFDGVARIDDDALPANRVPAMMHKYEKGIERLETTPEDFAASYSVAIRVTLTKLRGW